jgi:NADH-quinone oxidoreductase subunit A
VSFYIVAMLFIMFDIEIIFLYPYAVARETLGVFGFVAMLAFSAIIFVTFVYELARGAMEWGPTKKELPVADVTMSVAHSAGIKVVGLEGRRAGAVAEVGAA